MAMDSRFLRATYRRLLIWFFNAADTIFAGQKTNGISYSTTNGATWSYLNTGITNKNITDIEYGYRASYMPVRIVLPEMAGKCL